MYIIHTNKSITFLNFALFLRAMLFLSPVILLFYIENGLTFKELFLFQGIFYLTSIIIALPVGYITDIFSKKKCLITSFTLFLTVVLLWYFFKGYLIILFGEIIFAISKVLMDTATSGYLYDYLKSDSKEKLMPKYWAYINFYLALGTAIVAFIGSYLYVKIGSHNILFIEIILTIVGITFLLLIKNIPVAKKHIKSLKERYKNFLYGLQYVYDNRNIKYYMFYSGLLCSMSILFAMSFQPIMKFASFPIILFGVITGLNHGIRALSSFLTSKYLISYKIYKLRIPLYILYILAFCIIFITIRLKSIYIDLILLTIICLIIGLQLAFTILHVSRMHKFIETEYRGMAVSINNIIPQIISVIIFFSSHLFFKYNKYFTFYVIFFVFFVVFGLYLLIKTRDIKE